MYVFPRFPDLGQKLFQFFYTSSKASTQYLGVGAFRQQCERFLSIINDNIIIETLLKIFSTNDSMDFISPEGFRQMLKLCFEITTSHLTEHNNLCFTLERTLDAVVDSCFFSKEPLSIGFVSRWLDQNCPRLIPPLYKYCVYILTSAYRGINEDQNIALELASPILDKSNPFQESATESNALLPISEAWLLAGSLHKLYSMPLKIQSSSLATPSVFSENFKSILIELVPSHWTLLYNSSQHGIGSNRFLHHVTGYKGPSLIILKGNSNNIYCIASDKEWRETHLYSGGDHSYIMQLFPKYYIIL